MKRMTYMAGMLAVTALTGAPPALAVTTAEALDSPELTAFGAQRSGNADGSIPAYTGERLPIPACYSDSEPAYLCDPWNDKPLFVITAQNMLQHADRLTDGQKELLSKYADFRMDIYPSRRTARYPDYVLANTRKNVDTCRTADNGNKVDGCYGGFPFPLAKTGHEVMWNHLLKYSPRDQQSKVKSILLDASGRHILLGAQKILITRFFYDPQNNQPWPKDAQYFGVRMSVYGPARRNGEQTMLLQDIAGKQRAYLYLPGQRRVKVAPDLAYDTPSPISGGVATMDQQELFFGQLDRYDFTYLGVQEKFIVYNNFAGSDYKQCPEDVYFTKHFPNPACTRWELHRVRVVEATLKPGFRHSLPKRRFYFDEDLTVAGTADSYDSSAKLANIDNVISFPLYVDGYGSLTSSTMSIDLQRGSYVVGAFGGFAGGGFRTVTGHPASTWSPENMAQSGIR
ncbi:MAG: DUF1329 domain-containing protein [Pseudomonas sp.]